METIVLSLGGSLIVPENVDTEFLKNFREVIIEQVKAGKKFVIITGGGKPARQYQTAAGEIKNITADELDWLGIYATRLNAEFVRLLFEDLAEPDIILDPNLPVKMEKSIIVGGGWQPGFSTDYDAVVLAKQLGAKKIINLSNIDYAYDKDPKQYSDAKKIEKISWAEYRTLIPREWNPGLSTPFDPVASQLAEGYGIEVAILNGKKIANLLKCLKGEEFAGTIIS